LRLNSTSVKAANASAPPPRRALYSRDVWELWLAAGIALVTFVAFLATLAPAPCPGESGAAMAQVFGLWSSSFAAHPLWLLSARAAGSLPVLAPELRLNAFSALCGSLSAALLFRVAKRVFFEFIREQPSLRFEPTAEDDFAAALPEDSTIDNAKAHAFALIGGAIASLSFAFSAPLWAASTALHAQTFDLLLLLLLVDQLSRFHYTGSVSACMAVSFLLGLGVVESMLFVSAAPLALIVIVLTANRSGQISESFLLLTLATFAVGAAAAAALLIGLSDLAGAAIHEQLLSALKGLARAHAADVAGVLPAAGLACVALQAAGAVLLALAGLYCLSPLQEESARLKWLIANIGLTAYVVAALTNAPYTPWPLLRESASLTAIPALCLAVAAGALATYWCRFATECRFDDVDYLQEPSLGARFLGYGLCGVLGLAALRSPYTNASEADWRQACFVDQLAREVLAQAGDARCLLTNGSVDANILIRDHLSGARRTILKADAARAQPSDAQSFVEQWLRDNPEGHRQVATVANPGLWLRAGLLPVPHGLVYTGTAEWRRLDGAALLESNRAFWGRAQALLSTGGAARPLVRKTSDLILAQLSRSANDLGVLEEKLGDLRSAAQAYDQALGFSADNLCAMFNRLSLRLRLDGKKPCEESLRALATLSKQQDFGEALRAAAGRCGLLATQDADVLMPAILRTYAPGEEPPEATLCALRQWLALARTQAPRGALERPAGASASDTPDIRLAQALTMRLQGKLPAAERMLRLVVRDTPANLSAWSLLADMLLSRGETAEVARVILPAMRQADARKTSALPDMTEGLWHLSVTPPRLGDARASFLRALQANPELSEAADQLLIVDRRRGEAASLESDALHVLKLQPRHAGASALMGSLRLSQKRYGDAESYLRQSLSASPTAGALNDLAEFLRRAGRLREAEEQARRAVRFAPNLYQAWDTLGCVLLDQGRVEEASDSMRCAMALSPAEDVRPRLTLARLRLREGRREEASAILDRVSLLAGELAPQARLEYDSLRQQMAHEATNL
jgi:tetratricopeptide (TPR) repeat protein